MSDALEVAVAQCPAGLDGPQARLSWLSDILAEHDGVPLDLVVLPELFQCGYNIGRRVSDCAETPDGSFATAIANLAQQHSTSIIYGFAERQGDTLFNSAQCIDKNGITIGRHRKLLLPPGFEGDHFAPGRGCELFQLGAFTLAILVCYDVEFPENLRHVALSGADLVVVPTALAAQWGVVSECVVPTRAFENGVYLCYANYCEQENGVDYFGGSCIIAPDGSELARIGPSAKLAHAQLNKSAVSMARARLPYHTDRLSLPWVA
ncbi:carbon-nitrogen hydrolase family protein [uncultured Aliiroseovarius sp.]|uniref:carbon-nitrogen hydrolase family protein n=1 Tax=uncultured Aliiroseovarius sp. TaxID=1658783 RepID=UPI00261080EA|nr:carbon-nitrogen hydrolase family protein [uncultured Aliiroseovarius sp.]